MPDINIAITLDKNYVQHAAVMLYSLRKNNPDYKITVYAISDKLVTDKDWEQISEVYKGTNLSVERVLIDAAQFADFKTADHASAANYYRIQMAELLPTSIEKILYLDVDILVLGNIMPIYNIDINGYDLAAIEDPDNPIKYTLGLKPEEPYLNSGIMLMNLAEWRRIKLSIQLRDFILNNASLLQFWDQDAFNVVCKGRWKALPPKYNVQTTMFTYNNDAITYTLKDIKAAIADPVILHFTGKTKPWDYMNFHPRKKVYYQYLAHTPWKDYRPADKSLGNFFRKYKLMPSFVEKMLYRR